MMKDLQIKKNLQNELRILSKFCKYNSLSKSIEYIESIKFCDTINLETYVEKSHDIIKHEIFEVVKNKEIVCKSPLKHIHYSSLLKQNYYSYERCNEPNNLESNYEISVDGWLTSTMFFSSCMSAISTVLNFFQFVNNYEEIKVFSDAGYYETQFLVGSIFSRKLTNDKNSANIFVLETVKYDGSNSELNISDWVKFFNTRNSYTYVVIDTTLTPKNIKIINEILRQINNTKVIIFFVTSLVKCHQFGLDLFNCGQMNFYCKNEMVFNRIKDFIVKFRTCMGNSIGYREMLFLSLFNWLQEESLDNMEKGTNEYKDKLLFTPQIFVKLDEDDETLYKTKIAEIERACLQLGLTSPVSSSFGFRDIRLEYINFYNKNDFRVKISLGHYIGIKSKLIYDILGIEF